MAPLLLAGLLYVGSGVGLAALLVVRVASGGRTSITRPRGTDVWWLLGAIAAGGAIGPYLLMVGLLLSLGPGLRSGGLVGPLAIGGACLAWAIDNNMTRTVSVHDFLFTAPP